MILIESNFQIALKLFQLKFKEIKKKVQNFKKQKTTKKVDEETVKRINFKEIYKFLLLIKIGEKDV